MTTATDDTMMEIAERTADALAAAGMVFIEDDKLGALAATLRGFFIAARVDFDRADAD
ncbi:hypothetical protein Ait01nite_084100 [Actinoplanes italicus]|uniref:Uncharacterized protein n=1 Tax=Actinoplanes italicus TaxID=113567 RepID=A0A2T0JX63_9ACTN|nr:hypothetical protein [Actinoplanes italicus]PRX12597.1 hypothetical protein CLV67_12720 [Actinoplanes italicus]GIE35365.1 hypothetical protein Ait01nite_084100 [Actinoplanes italicus]